LPKVELHIALAEVISGLTGEDAVDILSSQKRDVDHPDVWRRPPAPSGDRANSERPTDKDRAYHRVRTRYSRLNQRLSRLAASVHPPSRTDSCSDDPVVECFHDLVIAVRLRQKGHHKHALVIAQRALRHASICNEPFIVLQACRLIEHIEGGQWTEKQRLQHSSIVRRWTEHAFQRGYVEAFLTELLVHGRHIDHHEVQLRLEGALRHLDGIASTTDRWRALLHDVVAIRLAQLHGRNKEINTLVRRRLRRDVSNSAGFEAWIRDWMVNALISSILASGNAQEALRTHARMPLSANTQSILIIERHRLCLTAHMRSNAWAAASNEAVSMMDALATSTDEFEQQRCLLLAALWSAFNQLGLHNEGMIGRVPRLTSFMNSVSLIACDRRGLNVFILIYEILQLLLNGKYDDASRKVFNLNVYASRNLRTEAARPLKAFLTFLRVITHYDLDDPSVRKRAYGHLRRMENDFGEVPEQMLFPVPLRRVADALMSLVDARQGQTSE